MTVGFIAAMDVEVAGIKAFISDIKEETVSGIVYTLGKYEDKDVIVVSCGEGKVNAAMCAEVLILKYSPDIVINTGVAGGLDDRLKVCDVAVAENVVEHDMDLSPIGYEVGYVLGVNTVFMDADNKIKDLLVDSIVKEGINCVSGTIASGDQFIANNEKKEYLKDKFNAIACEMEGAAVGHVCLLNKTPFGVLRAISDGGDDDAKLSFCEFTERASQNSIRVIKRFLKAL